LIIPSPYISAILSPISSNLSISCNLFLQCSFISSSVLNSSSSPSYVVVFYSLGLSSIKCTLFLLFLADIN